MKLEEIYQPIASDFTRVKRTLVDALDDVTRKAGKSVHARFIERAVNHLFNGEGKGLRPALVLFSARTLRDLDGELYEAVLRLSAVVELIHSASLIHDDVIDEAPERRRVTAVHREFGVKTAILIGDILYSDAFSLLASLPGVGNDMKLRLFTLFADLTQHMCYGEVFEQRMTESPKSMTRNDYLRILEWKTARLMSVCCEASALIAGGDEALVTALAQYGLDFGFAYQLADDYMDNDCIYPGEIDLLALAGEYVEKSHDVLSKVPEGPHRDRLVDLASFIVHGKRINGR